MRTVHRGLGTPVCRRRGSEKKDKENEHPTTRLISYFFVTFILTRSFDERIKDLKEYKRTHGHLSMKIHEDSSLYQFCVGVRHSLKQVEKDGTRKLTEERIARLDALGFEWTKSLEASVDAAPPVHEK